VTGISLEAKQEKLRLLQEKQKLRVNLPHLYGHKFYPWAREFVECRNRTMFLTAANQIGKSSTQIRKMITWATSPELWASLWPGRTPRLFWYLYPTKEVATIEFDTKWIPENLPKGEMKEHAVYGWKEQRDSKRQIISVTFNTGIVIYFKTYAQNVNDLQTASVDYVACDEELPDFLYDEINFRRNGVDGYFSMVFTATMGQELWRQTMEPKPNEEEKFPEAWKKQISLFECQKYEDNSQSHWTDEKIQRTIALCSTDADVQKRVFGKFVLTGGRKYQSFERANNVIPPHAIPDSWLHYVGVDIGAGGEDNHPSTISFIAVKPDFSYGCVYKHWRGDVEITTMSDVANKYLELKGWTSVTGAYYDYHAKDFKTITDRMGLSFIPAEKGHEIGEQILNTLFRNKMLMIFDIPENQPIIKEFMSLLAGMDKRHAKDDSIDATRYGVTKIPWDWSKVGVSIDGPRVPKPANLSSAQQTDLARKQDRERMLQALKENREFEDAVEEELTAWGELYDV
jgi:phage terminase large subunit-like protein